MQGNEPALRVIPCLTTPVPQRVGDTRVLKHFIRMKLAVARLAAEDDGQGLTEYALILTLLVVIAIVALTFLGGSAQTALSTIASTLPS